MQAIDLKYGRKLINFEFDENQFQILTGDDSRSAIRNVQINQKLDAPIDSEPFEELVSPGETVLFVVPDATRETGSGQIINLLVRRLIANGTAAFDIRIIFATGIHRKVTPEEKQRLLTPFIAQRIKTLDHDPRDIASLVRLGETSTGIPIELNRALIDHDHVILIGGINFHYFAGFTGGRKLVCPGLASSKTVNATHKLAFDCDRKSRRLGVGAGLLAGNAVHEAFVEAGKAVNITFAVNSTVNDAGEVIDIHCGDWLSSHRKACEEYASKQTVAVSEKTRGRYCELRRFSARYKYDPGAQSAGSGITCLHDGRQDHPFSGMYRRLGKKRFSEMV